MSTTPGHWAGSAVKASVYTCPCHEALGAASVIVPPEGVAALPTGCRNGVAPKRIAARRSTVLRTVRGEIC